MRGRGCVPSRGRRARVEGCSEAAGLPGLSVTCSPSEVDFLGGVATRSRHALRCMRSNGGPRDPMQGVRHTDVFILPKATPAASLAPGAVHGGCCQAQVGPGALGMSQPQVHEGEAGRGGTSQRWEGRQVSEQCSQGRAGPVVGRG